MIVFWGKVREGKKRGHNLGFPTANIALHKKIPEGIYFAKAKVGAHWLPALTFIGAAKTFGETAAMSETYLLNFNTKIYTHWLTIKLLKKLRENKKFDSKEALILQMKEDEIEARKFFRQHDDLSGYEK